MSSLKLTDAQFKNLLKLAVLGNWMINSYRSKEEIIKEYEELQWYLLSHSQDFGLEEKPEMLDNFEHLLTKVIVEDDEMSHFIDEYTNNATVYKLCQFLAEKEICASFSDEEIEKMDADDYDTLMTQYEEKYLQKLADQGFEQLALVP